MYRLSSFETSPTSARNNAGETLCNHAFQIFVDRRAESLAGLIFRDADPPIEICGRLDTIPLSIEFVRSLVDGAPVRELAVNLLVCVENNAQLSKISAGLLLCVGSVIVGWRESNLRANRVSEVDESLSPRERTVLECIGRGRTNKQIARELGIAPETVKSHIKNIFVKLAVEKRAQAICCAQRLGLVERHRTCPTATCPQGRSANLQENQVATGLHLKVVPT